MKNIFTKSHSSRKGIFFIIALPVVFILIMAGAFVALSAKHASVSDNRVIGDIQFSLISTMQDSEKSLSYIDHASTYAGIAAAYTLAEQGGFAGNVTCGTYEGYPLWMTGTKSLSQCYPSYVSAYTTHFDRNL